jgi:hypothetical protein
MHIKRLFFVILFPLVPAFLAGLAGGWLGMVWKLADTTAWSLILIPAVMAYAAFALLIYKRGVTRQGSRVDL